MFGLQQLTAEEGNQTKRSNSQITWDTKLKKNVFFVFTSPAELHQVDKGCKVFDLIRNQMSCRVRRRQDVRCGIWSLGNNEIITLRIMGSKGFLRFKRRDDSPFFGVTQSDVNKRASPPRLCSASARTSQVSPRFWEWIWPARRIRGGSARQEQSSDFENLHPGNRNPAEEDDKTNKSCCFFCFFFLVGKIVQQRERCRTFNWSQSKSPLNRSR